MSCAAIAAFLLSTAVANASPAPPYVFKTRIDNNGYEWVYVPGTGHVFAEQTSAWDESGFFRTTRRMRYFSPGIKAQLPEYIHREPYTKQVYWYFDAKPEYDHIGRIVGHNCYLSVTHSSIGIQWYPQWYHWEGAP